MFDRRQFGTLMLGGLAAPAAFAAKRDAIATPLILEDSRLWVAAAIGSAGPMLFVVDTGAGHDYIRPEIAQKLHLQQAGGAVMRGLGKDAVQGTMYIAHDVLLGGTMKEQTVAFAGYEFGNGLPDDAAGLMTAGLFTARDSDIDFDKSEWRLWRDGRPDREGLVALDSKITGPGRSDLYSNRMFVQATLDGARYRLLVDTGSPGTLLLGPRAAARSGLFANDRPYAPARTRGFGGDAARLSRRVRASRFTVGPLTVERPIITVMDPRQQSHTDDDHDGILGLHWASLLNWSTDTRAARLWAARNKRPETPESYLLRGVWLDKDDDGRGRVADVGFGSPAYQAGLRAGDVIVSPSGFADALKALAGRAGQAVSLQVQSAGGPPRAMDFTLRAYL
ncbi:aspartyl protease family protein [Sphingomonas oryzagri]